MGSLREIMCVAVLSGICSFAVSQQIPQSDNFNYTASSTLAGQGQWLATGTPGNDVTVSNFSLNYTGYPSSGTGLSGTFGTDRAGIGWAFQLSPGQVTSGALYFSMMILVDSSSQNGSNILSFSSTEQSERGGLLWIQDAGGSGWKFGVSKVSTFGAAAPTYTSSAYAKNDTHVVVIKYTFNTGSTIDDEVRLWVNPDLSGAEPAADVVKSDNGIGDAQGFNYVEFLEQLSADSTFYYVDGVRIATTWSEAPLPVQLTNFAAVAGRSGVDLTWSTATEVNNYGFEIERRVVQGSRFQVQGNETWTVVGFVRGAGTSTAPQEYSYSDFGLDPGRYAYRIKQIDFAGTYTYYSAAEVEVVGMPKELALEPNYPNPFNPSTNISFTVPQDGPAVLKVFNMLGQEVATLFNEEAVAGRLYKATFDASSLPTGVYVSRLEFGGQAVMRKMLFVK